MAIPESTENERGMFGFKTSLKEVSVIYTFRKATVIKIELSTRN